MKNSEILTSEELDFLLGKKELTKKDKKEEEKKSSNQQEDSKKDFRNSIKISNTKNNEPTLTKEELDFLLGKKEEKNVSDDKSR